MPVGSALAVPVSGAAFESSRTRSWWRAHRHPRDRRV